MSESWTGRRVTILGLGRSGSSTAEYLLKRGAIVLVSERSTLDALKAEEIKRIQSLGATVETGGHSDNAIESADLIVVSPGIPPTSLVIKKAELEGKEIICDIELAYREAGPTTQLIGITGTNGKSTTCALVSYILETSGLAAPPCGNFGIPILNQLETKPDYLVVEVSSYQMHYCPTFAPMIGIWLNLTPDHLDWHGGLSSYIHDKKKMFINQRLNQYAVLNDDDPIVASIKPASEIFPFSTESNQKNAIQAAFMHDGYLCYRIDSASHVVCHKDELKIIGQHNVENALAAISAAAILRVAHEDIRKALISFCALEHRLEFVGIVDGIEFYNDSKATNPTSTIKALEAFGTRKVVLIAGGKDKGTSLADLVMTAKQHVAEVILLGEAKQRFAEAFQESGWPNLHMVGSLEEAVDLGRSLKQGPVVLSPACASFDMFKDYEERGRVFKNLVRARVEKITEPR